jgi:hypothetical protein
LLPPPLLLLALFRLLLIVGRVGSVLSHWDCCRR